MGAQRRTVVGTVMKNGLTLTSIGVTMGVLSALAMGRVIRAFVWGVSPYDPWSLAASATVVVIMAAAACLVPAWRASMVDPVKTLAGE